MKLIVGTYVFRSSMSLIIRSNNLITNDLLSTKRKLHTFDQQVLKNPVLSDQNKFLVIITFNLIISGWSIMGRYGS